MKKKAFYGGWKRKVVVILCILYFFALMLSIERTVIDTYGQMWATMLLNCAAVVFNIVGLLGLCAKERMVIALSALWSAVSVGLNLLLILIYNNTGLMAEKERYLSFLAGGHSYWKTHGIRCKSAPSMSNSSDENGSGLFDEYGINMMDMEYSDLGSSNGSSREILEVASYDCLVSYVIAETLHAVVYVFLASIIFVFCILLLCPRQCKHCRTKTDSEDDDFSFVNVAQHFDYPVSQPGNGYC